MSQDNIRDFRDDERSIPGIHVGTVRTDFHCMQGNVRSTLLSPEQLTFLENLNALGSLSQQSQNWHCLSQLSQVLPGSSQAPQLSQVPQLSPMARGFSQGPQLSPMIQGFSQGAQLSPMIQGFSQGSTLDQTQSSSNRQQLAMVPSSNRTPLRQTQEEEELLSQATSEFAVVPGSNRVPPEDCFWLQPIGGPTTPSLY